MTTKIPVLQRFPTIKQISPVFALTFFLFNAWTLFRFFWKLPGWLYFLTVREILGVLAYSFSTNLLESMVIIIGLVSMTAVLPNKWFRDVFGPAGTVFVILLLSYMGYFLFQIYSREDYPSEVVKFAPIVIAGLFVFASLLARVSIIRKILNALTDRITVFLVFLLPLGIISLVVVLMKNIF